jgi:hypothetical protein
MLEIRPEYCVLTAKSLEIDYRGFWGSNVLYGRYMKWAILSHRGFVFRCINVSGFATEDFNVKNVSIISIHYPFILYTRGDKASRAFPMHLASLS